MRIYRRTKKLLFFIFIAAIVFGLLSYLVWGKDIPIEVIRDYIGQSSSAPYIFMVLYIGLSIFFPTTPMMAIAGLLFGFWEGILYTTIAGFVSSIITFSIARNLGFSFVDSMIEHKRSLDILEKYDERIARHGIITTIILRMTPIMPFNVLNLLMGISKVKFTDYVTGTVIGLAPSNFLSVYIGSLL